MSVSKQIKETSGRYRAANNEKSLEGIFYHSHNLRFLFNRGLAFNDCHWVIQEFICDYIDNE